MYHDLTKGNISRSLLLFALPMMAGNLLQQFYNIADTLIVGRVLGRDALAAVGSAYTLMTFLTSIFLGLSLGSGALFSIYKGRGDEKTLKSSVFHAFVLIMAVTVVLNILVYLGLDGILAFLKVPEDVFSSVFVWFVLERRYPCGCMGRVYNRSRTDCCEYVFWIYKISDQCRRNGNDRRTFDCAFYQFDHTEAEKKRDRRRFYLL